MSDADGELQVPGVPAESQMPPTEDAGGESLAPVGVWLTSPGYTRLTIHGDVYAARVQLKYDQCVNPLDGQTEVTVSEEVWRICRSGSNEELCRVRIGDGCGSVNRAELWQHAEEFLTFGNDDEMQAAKFAFIYQFDAITSVELYAKYIYESGQALDFLCRSCAKVHVGDTPLIRSMFLSYAATRVTNGTGIHISISGDAGTGKSHAAATVAQRLPVGSVLTDRLSDKALFYHEIKPKTVLILDDQELTEDFSELLKVSSTNWSEASSYRTVQNGKAATLTMSPKCPFWVCKANLSGDEQILDRQLVFWTDDSVEHRRAIQAALFQLATGKETEAVSADALVCREVWNFIRDADVVIPFAGRIGCDLLMDPRNIKLMIALIEAAALMDGSNREHDAEGRILATEADFKTAADIMNPLLKNEGGSQRLKLSSSGAAILHYLSTQPSGLVSFSDIRRHTDLSQARLSQAIYGRKDVQFEGLLAACPAFDVVNHTVSKDEMDGVRKATSTKAVKWSVETYKAWSASTSGFYIRPEVQGQAHFTET